MRIRCELELPTGRGGAWLPPKPEPEPEEKEFRRRRMRSRREVMQG